MKQQHIRAKKYGVHCSSKNAALKKLSFSFLILKRGQKKRISCARKEGLLTLLAGEVIIKTKSDTHRLGPRKDVFQGKSHSLFIGADDVVEVQAVSASEVVFVSTQRKKKTRTYVIRPRDVGVRKVGKGTYTRAVHDILSESMDGSVLLAGETFNQPGKWSSFPPHKHDKSRGNKETSLEEVYFFKIKPQNRFGFIYLYHEVRGIRKGAVYAVENNDVVCIPKGYHPVSAPPDTQVYYFWALAGDRRALRMSDDSAFIK